MIVKTIFGVRRSCAALDSGIRQKTGAEIQKTGQKTKAAQGSRSPKSGRSAWQKKSRRSRLSAICSSVGTKHIRIDMIRAYASQIVRGDGGRIKIRPYNMIRAYGSQ